MTRRSRIAAILLALVVASAAPAAAQIGYGIKAGVNVSNLTFESDDDVPTSARIGALAGVFATIPIGGRLSVQPEAIYTAKGASLDDAGLASDYLVDYLEVPLLVRLRLTRGIYVAAGPTVALRLRARSRTPFGGSTEEIDLTDDVESFEAGVAAAGGLEWRRWVVDVRYTHGLTDVDADTSDTVAIRNRTVSVAAGIRF